MESSRAGGLLDFGKRCEVQDIEIELRNHKEEDIEVKIIEHWYAPAIAISDANFEAEKEDEYTYNFRVPVKADADNKLTYTIKQCW